MENTLGSQPEPSFTLPGSVEELVGSLEIPNLPEITGGYADVYHGFWTNAQGDRIEVAIKILRALNPRKRRSEQDSLIKKAETRIRREVFFWSQTKHPNLHPFLGYRLQPQPQLVSPWCHHGDLEEHLRWNPNLSRSEKLRLVYQAGCGLRHLHSCTPPICHGDIKPGNVLINDLGQAALSDFGLSRAMLDLDASSGFTTSETVKGTFSYMAGELSSGEKPSCKSDIYAFGGLILTVMSKKAPFHGLSHLVILRRITLNEIPKPEDHPGLPAQDPLWEVMRRCWDPCPATRPTITEVLIELEGDIGREEPTSRSSPDLGSASDDGGSGYPEKGFDALGEHQQGESNSPNTPGTTPDSVPALKTARLSALSTNDIPLPLDEPTLITDSCPPTRRRDGSYQGNAPLGRQARLEEKPRTDRGGRHSNDSLEESPIRERGALWVHSVPQEIVKSVSDHERRRQEAIQELISTERDFVYSMEYLQERWVKPLLTTDIIPEERRTRFVQNLFWNLDEIVGVHTRLRDALEKRQKSEAIVPVIGDIYSNTVTDFECLVRYGGRQLYGKFEYEKEKRSNPAFVQFVAETKRMSGSTNLELRSYLRKPTAHLVRYPSLLELVLMYTPDDNPDKAHLVKVVKVIHELLGRVLQESRKTEARVALLQLEQQLVFSKGEQVDLRLRDHNRKLLYQGTLKRQGGQRDNREMQAFLLDHALLMVKPNTTLQQLHVYKRPIPLEFLVIEAQEKSIDQNRFASAHEPSSRDEYPINFTYLGRNGYVLTLWASSAQGREKWLEAIAKQQALVRDMAMKFGTLSLTATIFNRWNKVNCAAPFADGHRIAYGTERGVYFSDIRHREETPEHVLDLGNVMQVDVVIECELLVVLSERSVITVPLDALDARNPKAGLKRAKTISSDASFFKLGTCLGRTLLCVVNTSAVASTIKILEPIDQATESKSKLILKKLLPGGNDTLKVFKEFDIPIGASSLHLLRTRLCVGYAEGFQIIDLGTLDMEPLLDPAERSLDLVQPGVRVNNTSPTAIYLIENEFLLCYNEFAFYVDKNGRRARPNWIIHWEGYPSSFALYYPYVLAFEQTLIEVHNVTTGQLVQIIPGKDLHCLFADTPPSIAQSSANSKTRLLQLLEHRPNLFIAGLSEQSPYTRDEIIIVSDDNVMTVELALFS